MPIHRRELLKASAGAALLSGEALTAFAAPAERIQVVIDAVRIGEPISPLLFGGYMEPATTRVWAEMLTDRKFANPVLSAVAAQPPALPAPLRRFFGEPFRPIGPTAVEMDPVRPFVGAHSPRVKLEGAEPRGIQQSRLRVSRGKRYTGRVYLAGDPSVRVSIRLVWGSGRNDSQTITAPPLTATYRKVAFQFTPAADSEDARLEIAGTGSGSFHIGTASLMPADNVQGFHSGMIRLYTEAGFKMVKWPGGNFVSGYDFYDGLGDIDTRPPRLQAMWGNRVESNDVGLHEFVAFCRLLGAEPDLTINSGFEGARNAAEQVEYCNGSVETHLGKLRARNGHAEPFRIKLWTIGNEMYGPWQFGRMALNQYWIKHRYVVEAMRKVDPTIQVVLSGATICERSIGAAEKKANFFPSDWEPPIPDPLPWALGSHEDWTGWLLAHGDGVVDYVSEHTYSYPRLAYDSLKQSFVNVEDPLPLQARRTANRIGEAIEVWQKYCEKMPWLKEKKVKYIFDEWGCRHRQVSGNYQPPGMLTPLCYALFLNEMFRNSGMVAASCATGSLGTVLVTPTGEATGYTAEGLVLKIMATHFANAVAIPVSGNSPPQAVPGTPWVDTPKTPIGSLTFPLDVLAAISGDKKRLLISVVNPTESAQKVSLNITGVRLRGPGKLSQIAPPGLSSANQPGKPPAVEIVGYPQSRLPDTVPVPPVSIGVYEFEIESA